MSAPPARPLPVILQEISEIAGLKAALALASQFGGTRLYIPMPESLTKDAPLVLCVGMEAARKISKAFQREQISVPLAHEPLAHCIAKELARGGTAAEIARKCGTTERWVFAVKARMKAGIDPDQGDLFHPPSSSR